ncbi:MAG: YggS family pyridoxal phosphate-dependent enzyme [Rhizobiales bacterium]|nr:YggS family pyridoxal phosphate-dependent enzyme [Hyphomicrobiales bacterium]
MGIIVDRIAQAAIAAHRAPGSVTLVAVSKTFEAAAIEPVLGAGHRVFGENRVQEAERKWPALVATYPGVRLHLIGALQTNKARAAVALFDVIHSVDRARLVDAIAEAQVRVGRRVEVFLQVNTGAEAQKSGAAPGALAGLLEQARAAGLDVAGLMCLPPVDDDPAPHFVFLARLAAEHGLTGLSMGMSDDFETAIAHGATHVRVGSAIFGSRTKPA